MTPSVNTSALDRVREHDRAVKPGILYYLSWALGFVILGWAWHGAEVRPLDLIRHSGNIATLASDFFPPDFMDWRLYVDEMIVTIHIAIWGTLLAIVASIPLGFFVCLQHSQPMGVSTVSPIYGCLTCRQ